MTNPNPNSAIPSMPNPIPSMPNPNPNSAIPSMPNPNPNSAMPSDHDHRQFGYGRKMVVGGPDRQRGFVPHQRHIFLCHENHRSWPADFVLGDPYSLPAILTSALKSCEDQIEKKTILTICEPSGDALLESGDVLIFPDMIKHRLTPSGVDSFIKEVLVRDGIWSGSKMKPLRKGAYFFVCAHDSHDRRSGVRGELVLEKLHELVRLNKLEEKLFPIPCSDIGASEFAANVIIFSRDANQQVDGHWFAYMSPKIITDLIYAHMVQGLVFRCMWRGKLGNTKILELDDYPRTMWRRAATDDFIALGSYRRGEQMLDWDLLEVWHDPVKSMKLLNEEMVPCKVLIKLEKKLAGMDKGAKPWLALKGKVNVSYEEPVYEWGECAEGAKDP